VLKDDYLQTLIDRESKWPPKAARDLLLRHVTAVGQFSERFADLLRRVVAEFPTKSLATLFELQRPNMGVFQAYCDCWLANGELMAADTMPKKARKLQEAVQLRYLHQEYAFSFLASLPLTRLIAYVGAVRDVLLVIGDWLPDEANALRSVARTLSELATTTSAPSAPGGGFVVHRPLSSSGRMGIERSKTPDLEQKRTTPPPLTIDYHASDDESLSTSSARSSPRRSSFRRKINLSRSGSNLNLAAQQPQQQQLRRRLSSADRRSRATWRRRRGASAFASLASAAPVTFSSRRNPLCRASPTTTTTSRRPLLRRRRRRRAAPTSRCRTTM
jgi:hypothetical protein